MRTIGFPAWILLLAVPGDCVRGQAELTELAARGTVASLRLKTAPASWTVRARTGTGAEFGIRVVSAPPDFEARILLKPESPEPEPFARIVARAGKWYVEEYGGLKGVYRPWEAPFNFEVVALLMSQAWPVAYAEGTDDYLHAIVDDTVRIRSALSKEQRELAMSFLKEAGEVKIEPGSELERNVRVIRERLRRGNELEAFKQSGLMKKLTMGTLELEFGNVTWLRQKPAMPVLNNYPDFSAPLPEKRANLVMIGHAGAWQPGLPEMDAGGHLLNLDNGKLLRIPFVGASCMPGCFVADRSRVVVTAREVDGSGVGLYLVDLASGVSKRMGGEAFAVGTCMGPALSPDGKTLAVTHSKKLQTRQLYLMDLAGGKPRPIGKPLDVQGFSWLGDGSGLIGVVKQAQPGVVAPDAPRFRIVRFGLDGSMTQIRKDVGEFALVVGGEGDRVLFQKSDGNWHMCDLEGEGLGMLGDGLKGLTFPSASPDGLRVVMLESDNDGRSSPVVVNVETGEKTRPNVNSGRWILPAWK